MQHTRLVLVLLELYYYYDSSAMHVPFFKIIGTLNKGIVLRLVQSTYDLKKWYMHSTAVIVVVELQ
jgi:hypothetical protein